MSNKINVHSIEFMVISILIVIGIIAVASFVLTTDSLTKAQIEGKAASVPPRSSDFRIFLEDRTTGLNEGPFTLRLFVEYLGQDQYVSKGDLHVECSVNGVVDSDKKILGPLKRGELKTLYVSGIAEQETSVNCKLLSNTMVLQSTRLVY